MQQAGDGITAALRLRMSRPAVPPGFVRRARLDTLLSKGVTSPVTVVNAGPGFGKTLAVAAWARLGTAPGPVAWLLADEADDVQAFWTQMLGALTVADALPDDSPLRALLPGTEFGLPEVARIADGLERLPEPVVIVIDDLHRITKPAVLDSLSHLIGRRPSTVRLVLVTRTEPKLHLRRLQLAGDLTEIRSDVLAFTESETQELCAQSGFDFTAAENTMLLTRTQGWPAGLRLALLSIDENDVHAGLQRFSGRSQLVAAYLIEELLEDARPHRPEISARDERRRGGQRPPGPRADRARRQSRGTGTTRREQCADRPTRRSAGLVQLPPAAAPVTAQPSCRRATRQRDRPTSSCRRVVHRDR